MFEGVAVPGLLMSRRGLLGAACATAALAPGFARAGGIWPASVPAGTTLVAADQNEEMQTRLIASGEQAKLASRVSYANFLGGPAILEAFRGGALDLAIVGNTPPIQAQAAGERIPIIAAVQTSNVEYHFAVRPGLVVTRLEDLRGKKISCGEGTARQPFLLKALQLAGLTRREVTLVPLRAADFPDAVRSAQVDVAVLNEPHYSRYIADFADRGVKPLPDSEYARLPRGLSYLYASDAALRDSAKTAALANFVAHWIAARRWCKAQPEAWVDAYYVKRQHLGMAEGLRIEAAEGAVSFPLLRDLIDTQQGLADLIFAAGDLPKKLDVHSEFDLRFDDVIAGNAA